jgi:hypothetical protein
LVSERKSMFLSDAEIQRCRALVEAAFPRFAHWAFINERNDGYAGFSLWGRYKARSDDKSTPSFFVTFATFKESWRGHLTVGKHCYYWSSTDAGDAHLVDTEPCASLEEAVTVLKRRIAGLFAVWLASPHADPGPAADGGPLH